MAVLYFCVTMPIQTDEVSWVLVNHRALLDNYRAMVLYPQCGHESFSVALTWSTIVPATINHLIYHFVTSPGDYRSLGTVRLLLWLALMTVVVWQSELKPRERFLCLASLCAFFSLDFALLLLCLARPEQSLMLGTLVLTLLTLNADKIKGKFWSGCFVALIFLLTVLQMGYAHVKAGAFIPFYIISGFLFIRQLTRSSALRGAFTLLVGSMSLSIYLLWTERLACAHSADVQDLLFHYSLPLGRLFSDPKSFAWQALVNISRAVSVDFSVSAEELWMGWVRMFPSSTELLAMHCSQFLAIMFRDCILIYCLWRAQLLRALVEPGRVLSLIQLVCAKPELPKENMRFLLGLALLLVLGALFVFLGDARVFYLAGLEIPLLGLIFLLLGGTDEFTRPRGKRLGHAIVVCGVLGLLVTFISSLGFSSLVEMGRVFSFYPPDYSRERPLIRQAALECGIQPGSSSHLVIDDNTYDALRDSHEPFHMHYVSNRYIDGSNDLTPREIDLFIRVLQDYRSDGIVVDCGNFPSLIRSYAHVSGQYCCMSRDAVATFNLTEALALKKR